MQEHEKLAEKAIDKLVSEGKVAHSNRRVRVNQLASELERHDRRMALRFLRTVAMAASAVVAATPSR